MTTTYAIMKGIHIFHCSYITFDIHCRPSDMEQELLFLSELECCSANFFWDESCTVSLNEESFLVAALEGDSTQGGDKSTNPWYPDWSKNTCFNDGKQ